MNLSRNLLLLRLLFPILILLSLLYIINTRLDLRPNTMVVNIVSEDNNYKAKIHLHKGSGFSETIVESGEASNAFFNHLQSISIDFSRPLSIEDNYIIKDHILKNGQETSLWVVNLFKSGFDPKMNDSFVIVTDEPEAQYQFFVNEIKWDHTVDNELLVVDNPGKKVENPGILAILKTVEAEENIKEIKNLSPGINYFGVIEKDSTPIAIESITLERYFGRLDYYLPVPLKIWEAEDISKDFNIKSVSEEYFIENEYFHISPDLWLELNEFSIDCDEIRQSIFNYKQKLSIFAVVFAFISFFIPGIIKTILKYVKHFLESVGCSLTLNKKLAYLLLILIVTLGFLPDEAIRRLMIVEVRLIKIVLFLLATAVGSTLLYLNRHKLVYQQQFKPTNKIKSISLIMIIIAMLMGSFIFSYRLGEHDIREDEFQVISAAVSYHDHGEYHRWNWLEGEPTENIYDRAFPHTFLIAQSYNVFGISEWSSRLVSVFFGIIFIPVYYLIAKFFTEDNYLALLAVFIAIFYEYYIFIFRYARMYALVVPIFLLLVYFLYQGLNGNSLVSKSSNKLCDLIYDKFNYNYNYLLIALFLLYFGYLIHINTLVILPATFLFLLLMFYRTSEKKYFSLILTGIAVLLLFVLAYYFELPLPHTGHLSLFGRNNFDYIQYLTQYPLPWEIGITILALGMVAAILLKGRIKNKLLYLYIIVLFSLFFFIFIGDRYSYILYVSHIIPISMILILFTCLLFLRIINNQVVNITFAFILVLFAGINFYNNIGSHYGDEHQYGAFSDAYEVIIDNFDPENEVIFGQYLRRYYLQKLKNKELKTVSMLNNKRYSYETFLYDLQQYEAGWITWETRKSYHLKNDIIKFIDTHFKKLHGQGIDNSKVEVYYFQPSDLQRIERYKIDYYEKLYQ